MFEGVDAAAVRAARADGAGRPAAGRAARSAGSSTARRKGLEADLDEALGTGQSALDIINDNLLAGMRTVGELFGRGEMQLPFVLQSAEVMKAAVAHLEPLIERTDETGGKGTIVLATVKGDVHDIGKNLVDIILSNNGYDVVNLGIKQPMQRDPARRRGARRRRDRDVGAARQVDRGDEGEPRGDELPRGRRQAGR